MTINKQQQLINKLMEVLKKEKRSVLYGDLLRKGFYRAIIDKAVKEYGAVITHNQEGYSIITFEEDM